MSKLSFRFYKDREVRAIWSEEENKWFFSVLDVIGAINEQDDYEKTRNYWKYLKAKLKKEGSELVSVTTQLRIKAADGKRYNTDVLDKYVEMNVAHPFMEGNGRSTRIWLDLILKARFGKCVDWSRINKNDYLDAMTKSVADATDIKQLLTAALTDNSNDREMFMKGIDYSYYYEQED